MMIQKRANIIALEEALRDRWEWRRWYRHTARRLFANRWDDLAEVNATEIRRLVKRLRRERSR